MKFANTQALHLLWLLPLLAAGLHLFYQHRRKMMTRFIQEPLIGELAQGFSLKLYRVKAVCIMAAFVFMVLALSRPQWGFIIRPINRHGLDIMVVMDVSKSMLTQDVRPSRLERTKLAIKDLISKLDGSDHIGLIAFAGDAMVMCPLTYDYNGFLLSLDDLSPDSIPRGGTDIAEAIDESVKAYQNKPDSDKAVVLVTDGEDQEGDAIAAARRAHEKGVRIFTVGVGTREGDLIQVANADGQKEFLKDADGNVVKSHLNENLLQQIAYATGGAYIRSGAEEFGLDYLYDRQLSKLKKHDAQEKMAKEYDERFQWPLTLAFLFLLAETFLLSLRGAKRRRSSYRTLAGARNLLKEIATSPSAPRNDIKISSFVLITLFMSSLAYASVTSDVNKANRLYKQGKFDDSLKLYQEALDQDNKSPVVKYDLGTDFYKKGDYAKALEYLEQAAQEKNINISHKAEYNLGNVLYKSGIQKENKNVDQAIKSLQEALGHYGKTLALDPKDQDARFNQDFVKKEIERLKKKKEQQKKDRQQQNKNQKSQQNQKNQQKQQGQQNKQKQQQDQQDQKNRQDQSKQQENQQDKEKQQGQDNKQNQQNPESQQESQKDIDRKQAQDLLEDYKENEEPKKLLNYMPKRIDERVVVKDW